MTRARAIWLGGGAVVLAVVALVLVRRKRKPAPLSVPAPPSPSLPVPAAAPLSTTETSARVTEALTTAEPASVATADPALVASEEPESSAGTGDGEPSLPTWARAAIVGAALVAFLVVSLLVTKR